MVLPGAQALEGCRVRGPFTGHLVTGSIVVGHLGTRVRCGGGGYWVGFFATQPQGGQGQENGNEAALDEDIHGQASNLLKVSVVLGSLSGLPALAKGVPNRSISTPAALKRVSPALAIFSSRP